MSVLVDEGIADGEGREVLGVIGQADARTAPRSPGGICEWVVAEVVGRAGERFPRHGIDECPAGVGGGEYVPRLVGERHVLLREGARAAVERRLKAIWVAEGGRSVEPHVPREQIPRRAVRRLVPDAASDVLDREIVEILEEPQEPRHGEPPRRVRLAVAHAPVRRHHVGCPPLARSCAQNVESRV